jgi:hypothetical protein
LNNLIIQENINKASLNPALAKLISPTSITSLTFITSLSYYYEYLKKFPTSISNIDNTSSLPIILNIVMGFRSIIRLVSTSIHSQFFQLIQRHECLKVIHAIEIQLQSMVDNTKPLPVYLTIFSKLFSSEKKSLQNFEEVCTQEKISLNFMILLLYRFLNISFFSYYHKDYLNIYENISKSILLYHPLYVSKLTSDSQMKEELLKYVYMWMCMFFFLFSYGLFMVLYVFFLMFFYFFFLFSSCFLFSSSFLFYFHIIFFFQFPQ